MSYRLDEKTLLTNSQIIEWANEKKIKFLYCLGEGAYGYVYLVKNLVKFLTPYQIRVNAVAPGFVETAWQKDKPVEIRKRIEEKIAAGRFCEPDELAGIYQLLMENSYINGDIIVADGGYSYQ